MRNVNILFATAFLLTHTSGVWAQENNGVRVRTVVDTLVGAVGGVAVDRLGIIYSADFGEKVFKIMPDGRVSVFATGLYGASGNAIDSRGNLLQSNFSGNYVSKIDRGGNAEIFATGFSGPVGIALDSADNMIVCNCRGNTLSRVTADGVVTEFATSELLNCPNGITRAGDGNYYVANFSDARLLKVTPDGVVTEFATLPGGGNGHVAFARGDLYATSFRGHRVYRVTLEGDVTLLAGTGTMGETDGAAAEATFSWPNGIAAGPTGDRLYINDYLNRVSPTLEAPPAPLSSLRQITLPTISTVLTAALTHGGVDEMIQAYRTWKSEPGTAGLFTEIEVNAMGYQLMTGGQLQAATELFKLNAESYQQSFNAYDSLAEAYMRSGKNELAIEFYEKSLEINPANQNAVQMLSRIRGTGGG